MPAPRVGSPLPRSSEGCYTITRDQRHVGVERFEIAASPAQWRARGTVRLVAPTAETMRYDLVIDPIDRRVIGFHFSVEVEGVTASAMGIREGESLRIETNLLEARSSALVPFAAGAFVLLPTPVLAAVPITAHAQALERSETIELRTLSVSVPWLEATIERVAMREKGREGGLRVIELGTGSLRAATSWVGADGIAAAIETYAPGGGAPFLMRRAEVCADPPEPGTIEQVRVPRREEVPVPEVEPEDPSDL
ncbi:MAG: hypothetical protein HY791_03515 [Deltaproteobacteria bacterium]|nr:hypothetical protein [Deltaproteobacteria bacterium]